jgi:site-specific recombinase XerC
MVLNPGVRLAKFTSTKEGTAYQYWVLRWYDSRGIRHARSLGPTAEISKRQAELARMQLEQEIAVKPQRRDVTVAPRLGEFLDRYFNIRQTELAPGTMDLHRTAQRYLLEFFGPDRRISEIHKVHARDFKAALANGELKTKGTPADATVQMHVRTARKMFAMALEDDLIIANPFDKLAGSASHAQAWHEVTDDEFQRLMSKARPDWRLLLALTRWAGLRRGEALNLRWDCIDWARHRLIVIANEEWKPKDKDSRTIPIVPELFALLNEARATTKGEQVINNTINPKNVFRDFDVLCNKAGVVRWNKPMHTLRKTCLTRWAREYPQHVVKEWAGHASEETTSQFYLKVGEGDYLRAAGLTTPTLSITSAPAQNQKSAA